MGANTVDVTDATWKQEIADSDKPVLVDFWAEWCGPCRAMSPVLEEFAAENNGIKVAKVNVDENPGNAQQYGVMSIPTLLLFENGEPKKQLVGAMAKDRLEQELGEWR